MLGKYHPLFILFLRVAGAGSSLLIVVLLNKNYGDNSSSFFFTQSLCVLSSFFSVFGLNGYSMQRAVKVEKNEKTYLVVASVETLARTLLFVMPILIIASIFFELDINYFLVPLILGYSISSNVYNYLLGKHKQIFSIFWFVLFPNLLLLTLTILSFDIDLISIIYSVYYIFCFFIMFSNVPGNISIRFLKKIKLRVSFYDYKQRVDFFIQEILGQVFTSVSIVIAGIVLVSGELNNFILYNKVFSVCALIIGSINISIAPQVAKVFIERNSSKGNGLINKYGSMSATLVFIALFIGGVIISNWRELLPGLEVDSIFMTFSIAYLIVAFCSCSHYVLNILGMQKKVRKISIVSALFGMTFMFLLGNLFGVAGVVIGLSLALVLQAMLCRINLLVDKG